MACIKTHEGRTDARTYGQPQGKLPLNFFFKVGGINSVAYDDCRLPVMTVQYTVMVLQKEVALYLWSFIVF